MLYSKLLWVCKVTLTKCICVCPQSKHFFYIVCFLRVYSCTVNPCNCEFVIHITLLWDLLHQAVLASWHIVQSDANNKMRQGAGGIPADVRTVHMYGWVSIIWSFKSCCHNKIDTLCCITVSGLFMLIPHKLGIHSQQIIHSCVRILGHCCFKKSILKSQQNLKNALVLKCLIFNLV